MNRKRWVLGLVLLLMLAGCQPQATPWQAWYQAAQAYTGAVETLATLRLNGQISDKSYNNIDVVRQATRQALDAWRAALDDGSDVAPAAMEFEARLADLLWAQSVAQKGGAK